jgi:hypothetical protein
MTSFVEFHAAGFWCRAEVMRDWIAELLATAKKYPDPPPWLAAACGYWDAIRSAVRYARADLRFEVSVTTPQQQKECEKFLEAVGQRRLDPVIQRANLLAISLIRGDLAGVAPTVLEYWSNDEWLGG